MADLAIEVHDVAKRFRLVHERNSTLKAAIFSGFKRSVHEEFWALDDVSFDVPQGSTFALIGENGSGKSTMLKCLAKIYRPDRGTIRTVGKVSALLELGAGFHPELSGRENVYLNGSILGLAKREIDERFDEIVEFAGLARFIDSPVKNYSSGMFVRLGFSVAINVEPDILLVDEVLAVGDEDFQRKCMEKFAGLREKGRTIVVVSHGLGQIRDICDHAVWLDHGKIRLSGTASEVVSAYLEEVRSSRTLAVVDGVPPDLFGSVAVCDLSGREVDTVGLGEGFQVRIELSERNERPVWLDLDLVRSDGVQIGGTRTQIEAGRKAGDAIAYVVKDPPLHPGTYEVALTLRDENHQVILVENHHAALFDIADTTGKLARGLVALGGEWIEPPPAP
ncbi:MAG TPA: ABC transporter ATP-binding protein [Acidimicrobiales bacterium]|nr:ABC transporter ATP-binding protein [Acidimicrobiales bacterium]